MLNNLKPLRALVTKWNKELEELKADTWAGKAMKHVCLCHRDDLKTAIAEAEKLQEEQGKVDMLPEYVSRYRHCHFCEPSIQNCGGNSPECMSKYEQVKLIITGGGE